MSEIDPLCPSFARRSKIAAGCVPLMTLGLLLTTGMAFGQSSSDRATARNLAAEGSSALDAGDFKTAEDRFRRADALVHAPTLVVDHAKALMGLRKYVEAQERLALVIREGVPDNSPWVWKKALKEAKQLVEEVKPKLAWVTINVSSPENATVLLDGAQVPAAALGVRRVANPGTHKLEVTAPGYLKKELEVSLDEGAAREVQTHLEVDPETLKRNEDTQPKAASVPSPTKDEPAPQSHALGYAALAVGGAGLVAGTVTGILFLDKQSELNSKCPNGDCQGRVPQSFIDQRNTYGIISPVCIGLGLASGVTGVLLLLHDHSESKRNERTGVTVAPFFAFDRIGIEGTL